MENKIIKVICLSIALYCHSVFSYTVTPIIQHFKSQGKEQTQTFLIENNSNNEIALEFEITNREIQSDGLEKRGATDDFNIYPLQMTLPAQSKRNIRVTYVGEKVLKQEAPYRLIVRQLPINDNKSKSGVNFMFEYIASIYVSGEEIAEGDLQHKIIGERINNRQISLRLSLKNHGAKHVLTENLSFKITDGKNEFVPQAADWIAAPLPNYLPGTESMVEVKIPKGLIARQARLIIEKKKN